MILTVKILILRKTTKDKKEGAMKRGKDLDTFKPKPKKEEAKEY